MTLGLVFWILMLIWLVLGVWWHWPAQGSPPQAVAHPAVLFLLLMIIGWGIFGAPIVGR